MVIFIILVFFLKLIFNNLKIMIMKTLIIVLFTLKVENIRHLMLIKTEKLKFKL